METFAKRFVPRVLSLLLAGSLALLPGCDWFTGTEESERQSPYLSGLTVSPFTVLCGESHPYTMSFRYDDPQGDIARAIVTRRLDTETVAVERTYPWPINMPQTSGTVSFRDFFGCDRAKGRYLITVTVEDDGGHLSNEETGEIRLLN